MSLWSWGKKAAKKVGGAVYNNTARPFVDVGKAGVNAAQGDWKEAGGNLKDAYGGTAYGQVAVGAYDRAKAAINGDWRGVVEGQYKIQNGTNEVSGGQPPNIGAEVAQQERVNSMPKKETTKAGGTYDPAEAARTGAAVDLGMAKQQQAYDRSWEALNNSASDLRNTQPRGVPTSTAAQATTPGAVNPQQINAANIDGLPQGQIRDQQQTAIDQLTDAALGRGESVAQNQLKQTTNNNIAAAYGLARSTSGANGGLALRQAGDAAVNANTTAAGQAATLRAGEIATARGQLGEALQGVRGQDLTLATSQAQLEQDARVKNQIANLQAQGMSLEAATKIAMQNAALETQNNQFNVDATLKGRGMDDVRRAQAYDNYLKSLGIVSGNADAAMSGATTLRAQDFNREAGMASIGMQKEANNNAFWGTLINGGATAYAATASDKRVKHDIKDGDGEVQDMMDKLKAYTFAYDGSDEEQPGVMAQDLEKSRKGADVVIELGGVKHLDHGKAISAALASVAQINQRLKALEGGKR